MTPDPGARVLIYDIETTPNLGYTWGKWDQNVIEFKEQWYILSVAWKWLGDKRGTVLGLDDYPDQYRRDPANDVNLATLLRNLFDEADVTITHNGKTFDKPKAQTRMWVHGLQPPTPCREVDTLQIVRKQFAFSSNRLGDLCQVLGLPHKGDPGGFKTWLGCMNGDERAWATMKRYNLQDVAILEKLYLRLLPWVSHHPNLASLADRPSACPSCGMAGRMVARGYHVTVVTRRRKFQCQKCGSYSMGRKIEKTEAQYVPL
jgi:hypothetical protein